MAQTKAVKVKADDQSAMSRSPSYRSERKAYDDGSLFRAIREAGREIKRVKVVVYEAEAEAEAVSLYRYSMFAPIVHHHPCSYSVSGVQKEIRLGSQAFV